MVVEISDTLVILETLPVVVELSAMLVILEELPVVESVEFAVLIEVVTSVVLV